MVGCCVYSREKLCWADLSSHSSFLLCKNHGYRRRFSPHQCIHIHILYVQKFFMEVYTTWSIICLVIHLSWLDVLTWAHRRSINIFSLLFASSFKQNRSTPPIYYIKSMRDYEQHVRRIWWWYSVRSLTGPRWHECEHWKCKNDVLRIWSWDTFYGFLTFSTFNSCMHQKYLRSMCGFGAIDDGRNAIFVWAFVAMSEANTFCCDILLVTGSKGISRMGARQTKSWSAQFSFPWFCVYSLSVARTKPKETRRKYVHWEVSSNILKSSSPWTLLVWFNVSW